MSKVEQNRRRQRSPVFLALLFFELVLVLLQLWLFVSALEGILAGEPTMALPGAIVSIVCLVVNTWMLIGVERSDHGR
ncbi:MAG TPA: DUF6755 family protein [Fimbriimonadaceae bacterium]|nr:DUF6755 family protein [Fimbriimonadaceae bacterium]